MMFVASIPGGEVTVLTAPEVTVARRRPIVVRVMVFGLDRLRPILTAPTGDTDELAETIGLTPSEVLALEELSDAALCAVLDSWTLPGPVPADPSGLRALDRTVWAAVTDAAVGEAARLLRDVL